MISERASLCETVFRFNRAVALCTSGTLCLFCIKVPSGILAWILGNFIEMIEVLLGSVLHIISVP